MQRIAKRRLTRHVRAMAAPPKQTPAKRPRQPARPGHLARGRWYRDFPRPSAAEKRLVECCARGEVWAPQGWDWEKPVRPAEKTASNTVRAELIRFLVLGGDSRHPVHEEGVMVHGAWITGRFNLHQCRAAVRLSLKHCHFDSAPNLTAAHLPELALSGSLLPSLPADRLKVDGGVYLRDGFIATGEVRMLGAEIGGNLECGKGTFTNKDGNALSADRVKVTGSVFLRDGFAATGAVRMLGAEIDGDLACSNGTFTNKGGDALSADGIKVAGSLILRTATANGAITLTAAQIGTLIDQGFNWLAGGHLLDGLRYDRIIGPTDAARRIAWLKSQRTDQLNPRDWAPQPWEQLIKVLREMGHPGAAAEVAMEKQRMMRAAGQIGTREPNPRFESGWRHALDVWWTPLHNRLARGFHDFYGWLAGYGYRPTRIAGRMAMVWLVFGCLYWGAADGYGAIGPANPVITSSALYPDAERLCGHGNEPGKARWTECPGVPDEYSTFQPFVYSLDLILPLIDLQQEADWAPIAEGPTGNDLLPGVIVRWVMWLEILFGWFASLMFVAIVSRLVEKD